MGEGSGEDNDWKQSKVIHMHENAIMVSFSLGINLFTKKETEEGRRIPRKRKE